MKSGSRLMMTFALIAVMITAVAGIGIAFAYSSTTLNYDNNVSSTYLVIYPDGESARYSGHFDKEVEFHTISSFEYDETTERMERVTTYAPCSWYMEKYQNRYFLGSIELSIRSTDDLTTLHLMMEITNKGSINYGPEGEEIFYEAILEMDGHDPLESYLYKNDEGMFVGTSFDLDSSRCAELDEKTIEVSLYMVARVLTQYPGKILDGTSFEFTASPVSPEESPTYRYSLNGGTCAGISEDPISTRTGNLVTLTNNVPVKDGYEFIGWTAHKYGLAIPVTITDRMFVMPEFPVVIEAQYVPTAQYDLDGGTSDVISTSPMAVEPGTVVELTDAVPEKAEVTFQEWIVYKKGDMETVVEVEDGRFTMPHYPVIIKATYS